MKVASTLLLAALLPAAAAAQAPSSITITQTVYCANGSCHAREYDLLERVAAAAKNHQSTLDGLRIEGTLADDSAVRTLTVDGDMPHPIPPEGGPPPGAPPEGPPHGAPGEPPQGQPPRVPQLKLHVQATYRGTALLKASGEVRDSNGRVVERWTITT